MASGCPPVLQSGCFMSYYFTPRLLPVFAAALIGLAGCHRLPDTSQIESWGIQALHGRDHQAIKNLQQWAEWGLPAAQRELALALVLVENTQQQALVWLEKAALNKDREAQFHLAEANYKARWTVPQNYPQALRWYRAAAAQGHSQASLMLWRMAKYGEAQPVNLNDSIKWLQTASQQGNPQAMFLLSNAYAAGEGVQRDAGQARHWLEQAAELEYPVAMHELALQMNQGDNPEEARKASELLKEAADERLLRWNRY